MAPDDWISSEVDATGNNDGITLNLVKKEVGKATYEYAAPSLVDNRIGLRTFLDRSDCSIEGVLKLLAKPVLAFVVPHPRFDEFLSRLGRESDLHLPPFIRR